MRPTKNDFESVIISKTDAEECFDDYWRGVRTIPIFVQLQTFRDVLSLVYADGYKRGAQSRMKWEEEGEWENDDC